MYYRLFRLLIWGLCWCVLMCADLCCCLFQPHVTADFAQQIPLYAHAAYFWVITKSPRHKYELRITGDSVWSHPGLIPGALQVRNVKCIHLSPNIWRHLNDGSYCCYCLNLPGHFFCLLNWFDAPGCPDLFSMLSCRSIGLALDYRDRYHFVCL